jgi:hypothetical protein
MKIYHYTNFSNVGKILGKFNCAPQEFGIKPNRYIGQVFGSARERLATFGFLEALPDSWVNNKDFPLTWKTLVHDFKISDSGELLLEISIDSDDLVYVADRAHIEGVLYPDQAKIPEKYQHVNLEDGEESYMQSLVPLKDYLEKQKEGQSYSLPEVVIFNRIPPERIEVSSIQPLIEEDLLRESNEGRKHLIHLITHGYSSKELITWRRKYEQKHGLLENSLGAEQKG